MIVGYKLLNSDNEVVMTWGGVWGMCPAIPDKLRLPHGDVHCPVLGDDYKGFKLVAWEMDPPEESAT